MGFLDSPPPPPLVAAMTPLTRPSALALYQEAVARYAGLCREIGQVRATELALKKKAFSVSTERSASGRDDEAKYAAAHVTSDFFQLCGERDAVTAELDFLRRYLIITDPRSAPDEGTAP
jgi:hypothetical protein